MKIEEVFNLVERLVTDSQCITQAIKAIDNSVPQKADAIATAVTAHYEMIRDAIYFFSQFINSDEQDHMIE